MHLPNAKKSFLALACAVAALTVAGCSAAAETSAETPTAFHVVIPAAPVLSADAIGKLKQELRAANGHPPAQELTAAVFGEYDAHPRVHDREWINFLAVYGAVRDIAVRNGWSVVIEGYTQAQVKTSRDPLSDERAEAARHALIQLGYPPKRVIAIGRGVGGPTAQDRRVTISFVKE